MARNIFLDRKRSPKTHFPFELCLWGKHFRINQECQVLRWFSRDFVLSSFFSKSPVGDFSAYGQTHLSLHNTPHVTNAMHCGDIIVCGVILKVKSPFLSVSSDRQTTVFNCSVNVCLVVVLSGVTFRTDLKVSAVLRVCSYHCLFGRPQLM